MTIQIYTFLSLMFIVNLSGFAHSPAQAAEYARLKTGGTVLQVKHQENDNYRVKVLLPSGQVRNIVVNKKTKSPSAPPLLKVNTED